MLSQAALASGDVGTNGSVLAAMSQVSAALSLAGAKDIIATLPGDADATKIKNMLGQMNAVASKINAQKKTINDAISIATSFVLLVTQASTGQYVAGAQTAIHLATLIK